MADIIKDALKALRLATFPVAQDTLQEACAKAPSQHQHCFDFLASLAARPFVPGRAHHQAGEAEEGKDEKPTPLATKPADDTEQEKIRAAPTARRPQEKNEEPTLLANAPADDLPGPRAEDND